MRARREQLRQQPEMAAAMTHGRLSTYNNYVCRCGECRAANAAYMRRRRELVNA